MSNSAHISVYNKTYTHDPGEIYRGVEIWDDHDESSFEFHPIPDDDLDLLRVIMQDHYTYESADILDHVLENEKGIYIRGTYYTHEQIKHILSPEDE